MQKKAYLDKIKACAIHLCTSLVVAGLAAWLVFGLWYPYPYRQIFGGRELFLLLVQVDVVLGPLITLIVYNRDKSRNEKMLDFSVIGVLQLGALLYGLWTMAVARPVHTVFEYDRFRVVSALEVPDDLLLKAPPGLRVLPWTGPTLLSLRPMRADESVEMTMAAIGGVPLSARPELWQDYEKGRQAILHAARPLTQLIEQMPQYKNQIEESAQTLGKTVADFVCLPLQGRNAVVWTLLLDRKSAEPLGYLPFDSFD
ncbi:TfpX/TfpZ family type IV pilin accessory protein [Alicycliphilus denitrificans]|uniref:TfpX/TfpZ family type IV pilin accessory protein n=1 Tax=Alicycliphilus denitrificans TaxID=179636 RepID=UPI00384AE021